MLIGSSSEFHVARVIHPGSQQPGRQDNNQSPEEVQVKNVAVKCVGADRDDCVTSVGKPVSMNCVIICLPLLV